MREDSSHEVIIKNAKVVDGTGNPWYDADVGISRGRISAIGRLSCDADRVIDAEGLATAPGFIDTHSHSDLMILVEPEAREKVMQGVTTQIVGQDGLGAAPLEDGGVDNWRRYLSGLNGDPEIDWNWRTFSEYLRRIEDSRPATNVASLVGHGNLRAMAMGMDNRTPTPGELGRMKQLLESAMKDGAFGLSTGLVYAPCTYADLAELIELSRVAAAHRGILVVHMHNESDRLLDSVREVVTIGMKANVAVHISHFKAIGKQNWTKVGEALAMLEDARVRGIDVTFDQYPYVASSTFLSMLLPAWVHEGGVKRLLERLQDRQVRSRVIAEVDQVRSRETGWDKVIIASVETQGNKQLEGRTVEEIATARNISPLEAVMDLILEEKNAVGMIRFVLSEEDVRAVMRSPLQMVCTDGLILGKPHPRAYGSFPRVLGSYVREGVIQLEEAVKKMTSMPAQRFGLLDRGLLRPGMWADLVVFDPATIADEATYENPRQYPKGIRYVLVGGEVAVDDGKLTDTRAGRVLRHSTVSVQDS